MRDLRHLWVSVQVPIRVSVTYVLSKNGIKGSDWKANLILGDWRSVSYPGANKVIIMTPSVAQRENLHAKLLS